ncbi:response regulator transcription factor [Vallitalea okinawensis]|uniref:response regulator transcription factor n=1 Tax=Vallitalea okinawensis TaxID=2078660 RepID=UPI000CFE033E|nr:response regulator transcription factor [Vallitalea okinawensis]
MSYRVLIIEDEIKIRRVLKDYLIIEGIEVLEAGDGISGLQLFKNEKVDLIVLDIMLPGVNGWEVLKEIRKNSKVLVLMLTAKSGEEDNLQGYALGADDYITKPFRIKVLVAKILAMLKRTDEIEESNDFVNQHIAVDQTSKKVYVMGEEICLTKKEYDLLIYFMNNANVALSRTQILDNVWGNEYIGAERSVDACVKRLRAKVGENHLPLIAVRGYGYRFEVAK